MWKSKKFLVIISIVSAVVVLVGVSVGVALAADTQPAQQGKTQLMSRVAEILGIDQTKLEDAFKQASKELAEQRADQFLDKLVQDGKLTQQQADQYRQWLKSKPDVQVPFFKGSRMSPRCPLQQEAPNNQSLQNWTGNSNTI